MKKVLLLMLVSYLSLFAENKLNTNELKVYQESDILKLVDGLDNLDNGNYSIYIYDYKKGEKTPKIKSGYNVYINKYKVGKKTVKFN